MGTDTAFALGILTLVGGATPRVRTFLLTLVIVDDIVALLVIALAYTDDLSWGALAVAVALFGVVLVMRPAGVRHGVPYFLVGLAMWIATLASGVHATIAGVAVGLLATAYPPSRDDAVAAPVTMWRLFREEPTPEYARTASRTMAPSVSPNERLQHLFHPWTSYVVVPLFALANAGVTLEAEVAAERSLTEPIFLGIVVGLVVGKPLGIVGATWLVSRPWFGGFPRTVPWPPLVGAATVAGIGFTVSLLIADITFEGRRARGGQARHPGARRSSRRCSAGWCSAIIHRLPPRQGQRRAPTGWPRPSSTSSDDVDPDVDHVRGPINAPVTLVEYGDFECPYCGRAEPVVRELVQTFGNDLRFVFRHLPAGRRARARRAGRRGGRGRRRAGPVLGDARPADGPPGRADLPRPDALRRASWASTSTGSARTCAAAATRPASTATSTAPTPAAPPARPRCSSTAAATRAPTTSTPWRRRSSASWPAGL